MSEKIKTNKTVTINNRNYSVVSELGVGENTKTACPWIVNQYGLQGKRGAMYFFMVFNNGMGRLLSIGSGTSENVILAEVR